MKLWISLAILLLLSGCASLSEDKEAAELHHRIGVGHINNGNFPLALSELIQAEKLDPSNPQIQNTLGLAYFLRERFDLSENHLRLALSLSPQFSEARNNLGRVLIERGKFKDATQELKIVAKDLTYPHPERVYSNLGLAAFNGKDYKGALDYFKKSIDYQRDNCMSLNYYGRSLYEIKDFSRSAEALDKAAAFCQKSQFDEPQYYGALSYYQLGETKKSEARLEGLLKLYPDGKYRDKAKSALETMRK